MLRYFRRYKKAKEIRRLSKAVTENPSDLRKRIKLADMYLQQGNLDAAVAEYMFIADEYLAKDLRLHALALIKKANRLKAGCPHIHSKLALAHIKNGHTADALVHYRILSDIHKENGDPEKVDQVVENILLLTVETPDLIMDLSEVMTEGLTKFRGRQEAGQCSI